MSSDLARIARDGKSGRMREGESEIFLEFQAGRMSEDGNLRVLCYGFIQIMGLREDPSGG